MGTGTGFNAALLCAVCGDQAVTTLELDPRLAARGEENLKAAGYARTVVCTDAAGGWAPRGPYDRIVACSLLRPDPAQRTRLADIRDNLIARIAEAEREGRLGEAEGLRVSLAGEKRRSPSSMPARSAGLRRCSSESPRSAKAELERR
ncbi:protein-L-isoaspartate O-methyltransferase [Streptomyces sp. NPDC052236]|uniref:protein-L-isoaspartate O-methyltransferase n=1 Tax=Streptomyces sp. NPDC052236 TaxID=3365686 RepID=UPI0037CE2F9F